MTLGRCAFIAGALFILASAGAGASSFNRPSAMTSSNRIAHANATSLCPADPAGTGILPDGDFSQAADPGHGFTEYTKGQALAPDWNVTSRTIDLYGSTSFRVGGYCSIDLDGSKAGGLASQPFATQKGTVYYVTFILSGNGGSPPNVKTLRIGADGQYLIFAWDAADGNDAQNGKWQKTTWLFRATSASTTLSFQSLDPINSASGAVVANIAINSSPPNGGH
jgi:choice-of-anchor C domain-containing protein